MRTIISAIALLALLGQAAQAADNIPTPASQGVTVTSVGGMPQSHYLIEAQPIGLLACHLDLLTGIGECQAAAQHDAHVQAWQRQQITDRAKAAYIAGGGAK